MIPLTIFTHHSEPGDPVLLGWIKDQIDEVLGLGPETIVIGLGLIVIAMPVAIMLVYLSQRTRRDGL